MAETLAADIETNGLLMTATRLWQISIVNLETGELTSYNENGGRPFTEAFDRMRNAEMVVFHNGLGYDIRVLQKLYPDETFRWDNVVDTLVLSRLGNPERLGGHSLAAWGETLGFPKPEHEEWDRWSPEMEHRCNIDTKITVKVFDRLKPMLTAYERAVKLEHRVAWIVAKMIDRGFALDKDYTEQLLSRLMDEQDELRNDLLTIFPPVLVPKESSPSKWVKTLKVVNKRHPLFGELDPDTEFCPLVLQEFNPGSRTQIAERFIRKYGWKPSKFTPTGQPEISEDTLNELTYPEAGPMAKYMKLEKLIGQISSPIKKSGRGGGWLPHARDHGDHWRVHSNVIPLAAVTGRMSASSPNIQQVATEAYMRKAWVAGPGKVLVGVDADGLEGRMLAHYLMPYDGGKYARMLLEGKKEDGTDLHSTNQKNAGLYILNNAKRLFYAMIYGGGDAKLGLIVTQDAHEAEKTVNLEYLGLAGKKRVSLSAIGAAARAKVVAGIVGLGPLTALVQDKSRKQKWVRGIDGRKLWSRSPHSALNTVLQSAGAILMKIALVIAEDDLSASGLETDEDYGLVALIHDEIQYEAKPEHAEQVRDIVIDAIRKAGEELDMRIAHLGTGAIGNDWSATH